MMDVDAMEKMLILMTFDELDGLCILLCNSV